MTTNPLDLTPVEDHAGMLYKREDKFRLANGVNGSKLRACYHLVRKAVDEHGIMEVVSAASVLSPQSPMAATIARELGLGSVTIVGGTTPEKAVRHLPIQMAKDLGSEIVAIPVGYNPALQSAGRRWVAENPGSWQMPYGITTPPETSLEDVRAFVEVGAAQTLNLPNEIEHLVLPFGSGNTAAGVLYGFLTHGFPVNLKTIHLMTIGPDKWDWMASRLEALGTPLEKLTDHVEIERIHLHPTFATYGDVMRETLDGIVLHPTYEGKIARYLNLCDPTWWSARDGKTLFWIVGGPIA